MAKKKKEAKFEVLEEGYTSYRVPIDSVKLNPMNPRVIEDGRFNKLVESIKSEPHVLKIRPIVVNGDMIALGGNQRLKASKKAGLDSVWILNADDISDKQQRSFIIADNVDFGKWDMELLKRSGYEVVELERLGVETIDLVERPTEPMQEGMNYTIKENDNENDDFFDSNNEFSNEKEYDENITNNLEFKVKYLITIPEEDSTSLHNQLDEVLKGFPRAKMEKRF